MRPPSSSAVAVAVEAPTASTLLSDYKELLKPGITAFVVVMAAAGYLLGATGPVDWRVLLGLMVGTGLTGGGAAALNHVIERKHDARMARTASRPLPGGRMGPVHATLYATACVVAGAVVLAVTTNILTTGLSLLTVALYVGVYTPLKRRTIHNTLVGAVPGALPALGGAAAATGSLDPVGWALFAILYLWQLPHFYALAWMFRDDYQRGGFRMLPTADEGERTLASLVLVASLMLLVAGVIPAAIGQAGMLFLIGMAGLGTAFTIPAFSFFSEPTDERARRLLYASILYVPAFFVLVVADFLLR
ncbi:protoheme IX farnesyltransferase [Rubrivirga sp. SAORIC476]|mgnify:CR=1 FL=1|uniref:heme o synthase n=1 Tax=Rubrivirga sp. SAORIC476 TaxID=1961794 RepID=UPI000BA9340D|nr:heme o synthase [Rubrivirga sp. SAORIC476]MAQ93645.1 protoheme IX farnesyltransferase [Rhodothermaceae bacterium]MBC13210.1 protoheme IX farnesyltransferase [Rhodothermaceae bacterium]PAP82272.1 protoheme IX farnesyltransferase [Rubrivirga sp. SAORIC476]